MTYRVFAFVPTVDNVGNLVFKVGRSTFSALFAWSVAASCLSLLVCRGMPVVVRHWDALVSMANSVSENSIGGLSGYSSVGKPFDLVETRLSLNAVGAMGGQKITCEVHIPHPSSRFRPLRSRCGTDSDYAGAILSISQSLVGRRLFLPTVSSQNRPIDQV